MKPEELLKPRFKVIADYPLSRLYFEVGQILTLEKNTYTDYKQVNMDRTTVELYPHLFRKLEWWEDRKIEDMPEYIKKKNNECVYKVRKHFNTISKDSCKIEEDKWDGRYYHAYFPATEAEYLAYASK